MIKVRIPAPYRGDTEDKSEVPLNNLDGARVRTILQALVAAYPKLEGKILKSDGTVNRFVNVYVGDTDIRDALVLETTVPDGAEVSLVSAIAGG